MSVCVRARVFRRACQRVCVCMYVRRRDEEGRDTLANTSSVTNLLPPFFAKVNSVLQRPYIDGTHCKCFVFFRETYRAAWDLMRAHLSSPPPLPFRLPTLPLEPSKECDYIVRGLANYYRFQRLKCQIRS